MNQRDIAALMKGVAPVIRDLVASALLPLQQEIERLQQDVETLRTASCTADVPRLVATEVAKHQNVSAALKDELHRLVAEAIGEAAAAIPPGAPGKLPTVKAWEDRVYYEGDCVVFEGSTYQASKDTGRAPPHEDWTCIARAGAHGNDGRSLTVRGTYSPENVYEALDIVALNGGSFVARKDDPGACPGEGWQMIASRGKPGAPGESRKGDPGKGLKGDPGEPVVSATVDDEGMLTLVNGDGSTVQCDLYPLLSKVASTKP